MACVLRTTDASIFWVEYCHIYINVTIILYFHEIDKYLVSLHANCSKFEYKNSKNTSTCYLYESTLGPRKKLNNHEIS